MDILTNIKKLSDNQRTLLVKIVSFFKKHILPLLITIMNFLSDSILLLLAKIPKLFSNNLNSLLTNLFSIFVYFGLAYLFDPDKLNSGSTFTKVYLVLSTILLIINLWRIIYVIDTPENKSGKITKNKYAIIFFCFVAAVIVGTIGSAVFNVDQKGIPSALLTIMAFQTFLAFSAYYLSVMIRKIL